ncbi:apolipoprotein N-acyltransferase [Aquabacterium sp. J223]|uniref:apolipoprotein N-acyltransferase n=1 Tax=Aquabacterium sp. J223 TaxID=2898431 RepID=UPI0021AD7820|nr:apolipoprotein N-acyltransferase [Aquabacterium sp. J223]UUX95842.1 apolipoprotein N-acyltransferase [Aquabacterium sp. J223]
MIRAAAVRGLLALFAGLGQAAALAPEPNWALQVGSAALFWALLPDRRPPAAALLGLLFGTAWLAGSVWWLFISMHVYGGLPAPLAVLAVALLSMALSLYLALAAAAFVRWRGDGRGVLAPALLAAGLWTLAELARGVLFTGFPWGAAGYAHVDGPLSALAPWVGVYGMGLVAALAAALVGLAVAALRRRAWRPALAGGLAAAVLLAAAPLARQDFTTAAGRLPVTLLQTQVPQDEKFRADRLPDVLAWLAEALQSAPDGLVVAPETAVPLLPVDVPPGWWAAVLTAFTPPGRAALVGLPLGDEVGGYTNSVAGLVGGQAPYRYDKHHLVPFGEFIPRGFRWFTELMNIPLGDFDRGGLAQPTFDALGQRLAPNICYEDLFGEELAAGFAADPARAPTVLVNLSNIGWFGDTVAIDQHLQISRLRTLELQRPMLRATNTGATAVIDHQGRVQALLPTTARGALRAEVEGREGLTPFARWAGRFGLWPLAALALALVGLGAAGSRRGAGGVAAGAPP